MVGQKHVIAVMLIIIAAVFLHVVIPAKAPERADLAIAGLLNIEVISASRYAQKIINSPNAVTIATEEDIRRSGAVDLPDVFRVVPGVDIINVYGNSYGVITRGGIGVSHHACWL